MNVPVLNRVLCCVDRKTDHLPLFETDSNGMLMLERVTNKTQWDKASDAEYYHVTEPVAGNYFPVASPGVVRISASCK